MNTNHLRDQRGIAMLFELVLIAAVLGLVGFAVYQSSQRGKTASVSPSTSPAPNSAEGLATAAAKVTVQESASDAALSAGAEASADELSATDSDIDNLGSTSNAAF